jgi:Zn-dependent protease with chaperone function/Flp pilus assembly protein TadD
VLRIRGLRPLLLAFLVAQTGVPDPSASSADWYQRGHQLSQAEQLDAAREAFDQAFTLATTPEERASALAGRSMIHLRQGRSDDAEKDAYDAVTASRSSVPARTALTIISMDRGQYPAAVAHGEVLVGLRPGDGEAHALLAGAYLSAGRPRDAMREVEEARRLGVDRPWFVRVEHRAGQDFLVRLGWWSVAAMASFLALGLVALWAVGSFLSGREVGKLSSAQVHLLRNEETPAERAVGRLYHAVLWAGTVLFYAAIPMMVVLSLVFGGALIYWLFQLPRIPIQLVLGALIIALGGAWAVLRSLFVGAPKDEGGRRLTPRDEPRLFELLAEVAQVATARMVDRVHLEPDTSIGVREAGGTWRVLFGRGERVLHLGFGALHALTLSELKAILAHEYGHFSHGETRLTPIISRAQSSMVFMVNRMAALGASALFSPVYWFLRVYVRIYLKVTAAHSRRRELLADRAAALAYGGDTFGRALERYVEVSDTFDRTAFTIAVALRESGRPCRDLYRCVAAAHQVIPPPLRQIRSREGVHRVGSEYDSHPPPYERIARVAGLPATRPLEDAPAVSAFSDAEAIARELTADLVSRIDAVMAERGIARLGEADPDPETEARLAAAISLHNDALEMKERDTPGADEVLVESVRRIEREAGADDPALVPALTELSRALAKKGDRRSAESSLQRAIGILEARGPHAQEKASALKAMLKQMEAA